MNCNCIADINAKLRIQNLRLKCYSIIYEDWDERIYLECAWVDHAKAPKGEKRNPTPIFATFCPFCGKPASKNKDALHASA